MQEVCNVCQGVLKEFAKQATTEDVVNLKNTQVAIIEALGKTFDCGGAKAVCYPLLKLFAEPKDE
jgi:hypothetical protein